MQLVSESEQKSVLFMLKLEIRLNAEKISAGGKYTPEVLYGMLIRVFQKNRWIIMKIRVKYYFL